MIKIGLDTNCFLDALNTASPSHQAMTQVFALFEAGQIELFVSLQTLSELEVKPDGALELACKCKQLPHWAIGTWDEQVGNWKQVSGSWDDAKANDDLQLELKNLAKAGNSIQDRGAYIDSLKAGMNHFLTSDRQLVGSAPAQRIEARFGLKVTTPRDFIKAERGPLGV